jgi:hypothetical protein
LRRSQLFTVSILTTTLFACGGSDAGGQEGVQSEGQTIEEVAAGAAGVSGAPEVEERYQERIDEAWQEAVAGENPSATCAAVKGRAAVVEPGAADRALAACNLDIPVRYFLTYVERVEAGEATCTQLMTEVMTKLPAMTISNEGFRELARQAADTSEAAAVGAGAAILAGEAGAGGGANGPQQAIKDRLREPVTAACPNEAGIILR